ncbi:uncharacterized protein LOC110632743 [Hevea brasiliensis]|uniref:uncharacterized protein LOC110632743 n=1 Tax=Hevea brasiliensis TaxID=3981 RepID=UPI0025FD9021|nr:uncharacterized protein LOC110632743 [Hevea brasiliensis]
MPIPTPETLLGRLTSTAGKPKLRASSEFESISHVFVLCPVAQDFWLRGCPVVFSLEDCCKACMVLWAIWRYRNDIVREGRRTPVAEVVNMASLFLSKWQNAQAKEAAPCSQTRQIVHSEGMTSWSKPVANCVKCNSDAAVFQGCDGLGAGWVIRDSSGQLVKACQVKLAVPKDR